MPRAYVYEPRNIKDLLPGGANWQNIPLSQAKNTEVSNTSAVEGVGAGASIGATAGSVIPGIGNAVGGLIGGAAGGIYGWVTHGERQTRLRNVLPLILQPVLAKKGAEGTFAHEHKGKRGKGGLKVEGKAFRPQKMLALVRDLNAQLAEPGSKHKPKHARAYNQHLKVSREPPSDMVQVIISFPVMKTTKEAIKKSQSNTVTTTKSSNASRAMLAVVALGAAGYIFG